MKDSTSLLLVITATLFTGVLANLSHGADEPANSPARDDHRAHREQIMKIYDVDQNGMLDEDERAVLHDDIAAGKITPPRGPVGRGFGRMVGRRGPPPEILAKYDANQDGSLDETERTALHADVEAGKVTLPDRPARGPRPGRGPLPRAIRGKYDANDDGVLDESERAALRTDVEAGKVQLPPRRFRAGPGRPGRGVPPPAEESSVQE